MYQPPINQPDPNQPQKPLYGQQPPYQQSGPGQVPYGTPPPQQYPQQPYPQHPMMQQPPKKKRRRTGCIVAVVVVAVIVIIAIVASSANKSGTTATSSGTPQATAAPGTSTAAPKPTVAPVWTTTHTYTGNGSKKTETFAVPGDWKILWTCDPASFNNIQYNVIVEVSNSDGTPADPGAINTLCKPGNVSGDTEERQAGNVYLNITSEGAWTFTIQEMK